MSDVEAYSVKDFCRVFGVGRTKALELIREKHVEGVRVGTQKLLIPAESARAWFNALREQQGPKGGRPKT